MKPEDTKHEAPDHQKTTSIVVNAQQKTVTGDTISYEQLVSLAHDGTPPTGDGWEFTITYRRGNGNKREGSLVAGETVKLKEGMIFDVRSTDRS